MAFPLIPIVAGAGKLALGVGKGLLGAGVKGAAAGKKMASSMMKRSSKKGDAIEIKKKVIPVSSLVDPKSLKPQSKEQSKKSSGVESIDSALDRIDITLAGIIATVEDRSNLQRNALRKKNIRKARVKKSIREDELESKNKFGMKIPKVFKSAFGIMDFFKNILIGGLVLFVLNNIETIIDTLKNLFEKIKTIGESLKPLWDIMKWIGSTTIDFTKWLWTGQNAQEKKTAQLVEEFGEDAVRKDLLRKANNPTLLERLMGVDAEAKEQLHFLDTGKTKQYGKTGWDWSIEKIQGKSSGGPISGGMPYLVGENGPELLISGGSGYILDAENTARFLTALDITSPAQLQEGRESLKPPVIKIADQSSRINLPSKVASLKTIPSYAISGGNTIVLMGGNEQQPSVQSSGGSSGPVLIAGPSKKEVLNSFYDSRFKSSLYKVG
jgi:hypothetical protein